MSDTASWEQKPHLQLIVKSQTDLVQLVDNALRQMQTRYNKIPQQIWFPFDLYIQAMSEFRQHDNLAIMAISDPPAIDLINGVFVGVYVPTPDYANKILIF